MASFLAISFEVKMRIYSFITLVSLSFTSFAIESQNGSTLTKHILGNNLSDTTGMTITATNNYSISGLQVVDLYPGRNSSNACTGTPYSISSGTFLSQSAFFTEEFSVAKSQSIIIGGTALYSTLWNQLANNNGITTTPGMLLTATSGTYYAQLGVLTSGWPTDPSTIPISTNVYNVKKGLSAICINVTCSDTTRTCINTSSSLAF